MNIKSSSEIVREPAERKSPDLGNTLQKHSNTHIKNHYIGLTLMEYFKLSNSNDGLEEIDEESNSSISAGTPCFVQLKDKQLLPPGSKKHRRDKFRTETEQQFMPTLKDPLDQNIHKIATINFDEMTVFDKNIVKLPSIHDHRQLNNSRQGMIKQGKVPNKKEHTFKNKNQQNHSNNNSSLNKQCEKSRIHQVQRNALVMKKSIRARVTSTSFYQICGKDRERERIKTEEEPLDKHLQKSFIVSKYGGFMNIGTKKYREQINVHTLKKQQNTFKMLKNVNN